MFRQRATWATNKLRLSPYLVKIWVFGRTEPLEEDEVARAVWMLGFFRLFPLWPQRLRRHVASISFLWLYVVTSLLFSVFELIVLVSHVVVQVQRDSSPMRLNVVFIIRSGDGVITDELTVCFKHFPTIMIINPTASVTHTLLVLSVWWVCGRCPYRDSLNSRHIFQMWLLKLFSFTV